MALVILFSACQPNERKIEFRNFSNLKLGFTTQNFIEAVPVSKENSIMFIDYAKAKGFSWIELRDSEATLTSEECREISDYAATKGIEIAYAIQKGLLDEDYWEVFNRGVINASVFKGPGTFRSLACGDKFSVDQQKKGWNAGEFEILLANARKAVQEAKWHGLQMVFENGNESLSGKDSTYFGLNELFANAGETVGWQFDVANPFSGSRGKPTVNDVTEFLEKYKSRLHYIHLKSSVNGTAQAVLSENPLPFEKVFRIMNENNIPYVAIELAAVKSKEEVEQNMDRSISYLKEEGFIK